MGSGVVLEGAEERSNGGGGGVGKRGGVEEESWQREVGRRGERAGEEGRGGEYDGQCSGDRVEEERAENGFG